MMKIKLKITKVETHDVIMPCRAPLQSGGGGQRLKSNFPTVRIDESETGNGLPGHALERTFIVLHTDEGVTGVGETSPFPPCTFSPLLGRSPFDLEDIHHNFPGMENGAWVAVEMACMDIIGKVLDVPVYKLLNGDNVRPKVPHSAYCFFRLPNIEGKGGVHPDNYVTHCQDLIRTFGFTCLKLKMGVYHPDIEVELVHQVREAVGKDVAIRMDVNGVWSQSTAVRALKKLEDCDLEYMEDPLQTTHQHAIHDFQGLAMLRRRFRTPIAADGNYRIRNLVEVIRYDAADVILGDFYGCNGIKGTQQFFHIVSGFNLALSMHSGYEMGVTLAARAHVAAATPGLLHPIDMHYHQLTDDVITGGMWKIQDGCIALTDASGLGVSLDSDKLEHYRWTQEKRDENQRVCRELIERYQVSAPNTWTPKHGVYPDW